MTKTSKPSKPSKIIVPDIKASSDAINKYARKRLIQKPGETPESYARRVKWFHEFMKKLISMGNAVCHLAMVELKMSKEDAAICEKANTYISTVVTHQTSASAPCGKQCTICAKHRIFIGCIRTMKGSVEIVKKVLQKFTETIPEQEAARALCLLCGP